MKGNTNKTRQVFGVGRTTTGRLVSVVNNLYHTKKGRYDVDSVLYCLARMRVDLRMTQQALLVMFLRQGMMTHPDYSGRYEEYMKEWEKLKDNDCTSASSV